LKTFRSIKLQSNDVFEPHKLNVTLGLMYKQTYKAFWKGKPTSLPSSKDSIDDFSYL